MSAPTHTTPRPVDQPAIGVGSAHQPIPAITATRLSRYRMRHDRAGLNLHGGELLLCAPYEPAYLGMIALVRCEADNHAPGALLSIHEVDFVEETAEVFGPLSWGKPGVRG